MNPCRTDIKILFALKQDVRTCAGNLIYALHEKCFNTEFFLVRIFLYSVRIQENTDQRKLRIWPLFTQWWRKITGKCRLAKKNISVRCCIVLKKIKKMNYMSEGRFKEDSLNFNFAIASTKLNYGDIFSFPSKLTFDSNICTKLLIMEQKTNSNCPFDTLVSLKSNFWRLKYFALLKCSQKLQTF